MSPHSRPNILFILIDDMGCRDLNCLGSTFYETPNLDRLAREGMTFTNGYAACPVCSPTRASILSGKYPARVGVTDFIGGNSRGKVISAPYTWELPQSETCLASALREGGYQTWHVGKWHLGGPEFWPENHGFDVNVGGCHWGMPKAGYFSPYEHPTLPDGPEGEYLTDRLTDEAIGLIEAKDADRPFFMYLSHYAVHTPIQAPEPLIEKYRQKAARLGLDRVDPCVEGEHFKCEHKRDQRTKFRYLQSDPTYAAMMENLDTNIGRVLAALEATGEADNTLVVFTSDNGGLATAEGSPTCNLPFQTGKGWMYEGGTREAMLVKWPGRVAADSRCHVPVTSPDFYPTLLAAAGLPLRPEQHTDGVSLLPLLEGAQELERDAIYWHYPHYGNQGGEPGCSIRAGDWKLIEFFEDGRLELYNLADDVSETRDLAGDDPARVQELHAKLVAWRESVGAILPTPNPDYVP